MARFGLKDMGVALRDKKVLDRILPVVPRYRVEPYRTALLVLDMNYVCAHRDYGIGPRFPTIGLSPDYYYDRIDDTVVPNIQRLLALFRGNGLKVIYTAMGAEREDLSDLPPTWRKIYPRIGYHKALPGSKELEVREEVKPLPGEPVLLKRSSGAFASTSLGELLEGLDTLIITGVETDCCIYNTAIEGNDRGYKVIVVDDATTTLTRTGHKLFLEAYGAIFFFNVKSTEQVVNEVKKGVKAKEKVVVR